MAAGVVGKERAGGKKRQNKGKERKNKYSNATFSFDFAQKVVGFSGDSEGGYIETCYTQTPLRVPCPLLPADTALLLITG